MFPGDLSYIQSSVLIEKEQAGDQQFLMHLMLKMFITRAQDTLKSPLPTLSFRIFPKIF